MNKRNVLLASHCFIIPISLLAQQNVEINSSDAMRILRIKGDYFSANRGRLHGVRENDIYNISRMGIGIIGRARVVIVREEVSALEILDFNNAYSLKVGDLLQKQTSEAEGILHDIEPSMNNFAHRHENYNTNSFNNTFFQIGFKVGYFKPTEEAINEIYGGGISFGADLAILVSSGLGGVISIEVFQKSGEPLIFDPDQLIEESEAKISIVSISVSGIYRLSSPKTSTYPYLGAGLGLYRVDEELTVQTQEGSFSASFSKNQLGFQAIGGIQTSISSKSYIFLEAKYSSVSVSGSGGLGGTDVNLGGLSLFLGTGFNLH